MTEARQKRARIGENFLDIALNVAGGNLGFNLVAVFSCQVADLQQAVNKHPQAEFRWQATG